MKTYAIAMVVWMASVSALADYTEIITGGYFGTKTFREDQNLLMTGGGCVTLEGWDRSVLEIQNTSPLGQLSGGIWTLRLLDNSQLLFSNGGIRNLDIYEDATAVLSGGQIDRISSYQFSSDLKHITFICDVASVLYTGNLLTGNWLDGNSFSITLIDQSPYDSVFSNIRFVPEPATLVMLGTGGLLLRRRK